MKTAEELRELTNIAKYDHFKRADHIVKRAEYFASNGYDSVEAYLTSGDDVDVIIYILSGKGYTCEVTEPTESGRRKLTLRW